MKYLKKISLIYILICCLISVFLSPIVHFGAGGLNNGTLLSHWKAYRIKDSYFKNLPMLNEKTDWCLGYGMSGLDGGEGGIMCGYGTKDKKIIYINPYYDCSLRDENNNCKNIKDQQINKYQVDDFLNLNLKKKFPSSIRNVREAYKDFDPNLDWFWFKYHYGELNRFNQIFRNVYLILLPGFLLGPFVITFLIIRWIFRLLRKRLN